MKFEVGLLQGKGEAFGKFGELLQGSVSEKFERFSISLPITKKSEVHFQYFDQNILEKTIIPKTKRKTFLLVEKIMHYHGALNGWKVIVDSTIEEGKGLGSSTADLIACARAIEQALGKKISQEHLLRFLREIEPSDASMYDEVVCFYHNDSILRTRLGPVPSITILGVDEGGIVDTMNFNLALLPYTNNEEIQYSLLLEEMILAFKENNLQKVGEISTQSALLHQKKLPKKNLSLFIELAKESKALGVIIAHSGTYLGIMLDSHYPNYIKQLNFIEKKLAQNNLVVKKFHTKRFSNSNV